MNENLRTWRVLAQPTRKNGAVTREFGFGADELGAQIAAYWLLTKGPNGFKIMLQSRAYAGGWKDERIRLPKRSEMATRSPGDGLRAALAAESEAQGSRGRRS